MESHLWSQIIWSLAPLEVMLMLFGLTGCARCAEVLWDARVLRWQRLRTHTPGTGPDGWCLRTDMGKQAGHAASPDDPRSDESLMEAFREGTPSAFEVLVLRHRRGLYNFLLRSVRNPSRAEEMLQDVFLRVIRSKDRYRRRAKFTTWVYTIARNLCVDESRRARFRGHESLDAPRRGREGGESGRSRLATVEATQVAVDDGADAPRIRERLADAVGRLPEDQREVFLMRQLGGLSFREIGETVGAPENTVKSRMRYALEKLREDLADLTIDLHVAREGVVHG